MVPPTRCVCIAAAVLASGCFLERSAIDRPRDAHVDFDAALDAAGSRDSGPRDSGHRDSGLPDSGPPDSGPPSCDSLYGTANGYVLCEERATECEMVILLDGERSCLSTCGGLLGRCITAYRNELPFPPCERQGDAIPCDTLHMDDICICSRGP